MVDDITFAASMDVTASWYEIKRISNYQDIVGDFILSRLLTLEPSAVKLFKFTTANDDEDNMTSHPLYRLHARAIVNMIDVAVDLLGPDDIDLLQEDLFHLGARHIRYGVHAGYLPSFGNAVDDALRTMLPRNMYTEHMQTSWKITLDRMMAQMTLGMESEIRKICSSVTMSWNEIKKMPQQQQQQQQQQEQHPNNDVLLVN